MSAAPYTHLPLEASAFGQPSGTPVSLLQTHIGCVYLVGKFAFKLKKHVKFDFLDFTTIDQRKWACQREVDLNRRLCPNLYLGLFPIIEACSGRRRIELNAAPAAGERVVDWAVQMERLDLDRMLDKLLAQGSVRVEDARAIAAVVAPFYKSQRGAIAPGGLGDLDCVRSNIDENIREGWALDRSVLPEASLKLIETRARYFLAKHGGIIQQRAKDGFVADGHGDLRSENICLPENGPPLLFDCIEFNDRFRVCDSALDVAFLVMDLDARGRQDLSSAFLRIYKDQCDPALPEKLLNFYLGYRAFVKAKVNAWIAADSAVDGKQRESAADQARSMFDLAVRYALKNQPALIVFCGPAGSGKSTLASAIAQRLGCAHLATDLVRDELIPKGPPEIRYTPENSFRVYNEVQRRAQELLAANQIVIVDGTFTSSSTRERIAQMASEQRAPSILVWADCPAQKLEEHLRQRQLNGDAFGSEAGSDVATKQRAGFEKPKPREGFSAVCRVDTGVKMDAVKAEAWGQVLIAIASSQSSSD